MINCTHILTLKLSEEKKKCLPIFLPKVERGMGTVDESTAREVGRGGGGRGREGGKRVGTGGGGGI